MRVEITCAGLADASPLARSSLPADLAFCHPSIRGVLGIDRAMIALEVSDDSEDLRRQVAKVVELSLQSYRYVREEKPLWRHHALDRYDDQGATLEAFLAEHTVTLGPGQYVLKGPAAELRTFVDLSLQTIASAAGAEPWHLPSIEQTHDVIQRTGYLASHAPHVTFGYRFPCHFEELERFTRDAKERKLAWPEMAHALEPTGFILEPFVCHNVYRALRGTHVTGGRAITALGTCYRHEGFRFAPLLRQWEFSMREVVLVGSASYVAEVRERLVELTKKLATDLDLDASLEIATDPFFVSEAGSARAFQALQSTKLEMRLGIDASTVTAACSFNLHGDHFTLPMEVTDPQGRPVETACIAWGIERWMAAIVARWGGPPT